MSLTVSHGCWLSLIVSLVPWSCYMSITVSHVCCLSLTVSLVPLSCFMSLTVSYCSWFSLTVSLSSSDFLLFSHIFPWLLAAFHCLSGE